MQPVSNFKIRTFSRLRILQLCFYFAICYFIYLMVLITMQYIPVNTDVAFLKIKQDEIRHIHYRYAFFIHVYTAIFVLISGLFQFSGVLRKKFKAFHRATGKTYVILVLLLAGPSGMIMGYYANGGIAAQLSFCLLAALWMFFTAMAFFYAKKGKWQLHRNYMYRSYALTLSAVSLRLFKWMIAGFFDLPPMDTYVIVAWLGWLFNLAIAEMIIYYKASAI